MSHSYSLYWVHSGLSISWRYSCRALLGSPTRLMGQWAQTDLSGLAWRTQLFYPSLQHPSVRPPWVQTHGSGTARIFLGGLEMGRALWISLPPHLLTCHWPTQVTEPGQSPWEGTAPQQSRGWARGEVVGWGRYAVHRRILGWRFWEAFNIALISKLQMLCLWNMKNGDQVCL